MHASDILHHCLSRVLEPMHAARERRLLQAVEALVQGRRLTLTDLARSWPGATWVHAPLKALDRLLSNRHLQAAIKPLHQAMATWLLRSPQPVLLVDWADLEDGRWCLLRAAVPIGGRALTLYERIEPHSCMSQPKVERAFLDELATLLPEQSQPILVTDAGFRSDWFRAVHQHGWHFLGRLRSNTHVCPWEADAWSPCASLHEGISSKPKDLGDYRIVKGRPMPARLIGIRRVRRGREQYTRKGTPQQGTSAKKARKAAREPWLLVTSLEAADCSAAQAVRLYAQRMQIEEAFRDLKSHRYGMGFEDSLTRGRERLSVLLLIHALATLAAWLMGLAERVEADDLIDPLTRQRGHRTRYSLIRRGFEWLRRATVPPNLRERLRPSALDRLVEAHT